MRVLLIEDDSATAQSIELMLKSEGFNVYTTDLGEEGVDLGKIYDFLAQIGRIDVEALRLEHQLDALRGGAVVFDQQYPHLNLPLRSRMSPQIP